MRMERCQNICTRTVCNRWRRTSRLGLEAEHVSGGSSGCTTSNEAAPAQDLAGGEDLSISQSAVGIARVPISFYVSSAPMNIHADLIRAGSPRQSIQS